jgi:predicted nucleotidyltransferase
MKICAIICEYNPFHNGHLHHLREARTQTGADAVVCVMSGNFVQRGENALLDKYTRAKHAVLAGADVVIELPTPFATSNAELFAQGAIHIISSIPTVQTLCFGAEKADKLSFINASRYLIDEPKEVSEAIQSALAEGESYANARAKAYAGFIPFDILSSPNNILGLEYTKAILKKGADIDILPIPRLGAGYSDKQIHENFSSATAIRTALKAGETVTENVPNFVANDLSTVNDTPLDVLEKYAILTRTTEEIRNVLDCNEGLENAFKKASESPSTFAESLTSPRYTSSRIRRIALQNLLKIEEQFIRGCLQSPLYLRVLAANKSAKDMLLALSNANFPVLTRGTDTQTLSSTAKTCFEKDTYAEQVHAVLYGKVTDRKIFI